MRKHTRNTERSATHGKKIMKLVWEKFIIRIKTGCEIKGRYGEDKKTT